MRRFLLYVSLFSLIVVCLLAAGEIYVRKLPNPYSDKLHAIDSIGDKAELVILGNSHTYYGLIADSLPDAISLANISQTYEYDYRILDKYIHLMPGLKQALIDVSYSSFHEIPFEEGTDWKSEINYKLYLDIDKYPDLSIRNLQLTDFKVYSGKLSKALTGKKQLRCSPRGFGLDYTDETIREKTPQGGKERAKGHTCVSEGHEAHNILYFRKLIELCIRNGIKPVLITVPTHTFYRQSLDSMQLKSADKILRYLINKYDLDLIDMSEDPDFNSNDFWDVDHLSRSGAEKLTNKIRTILTQTDKQTGINLR